jgi:putative transposase
MHRSRKPNRLAGYDYSRPNFYFVSPIIKGRYHYFGEIHHGKMILSEFGEIANNQFIWLQNQYSYIRIPIWVIMPDHAHAIIEIRDIESVIDNPPQKIKSLSSLMGAYKTTSSKLIHMAGLKEFAWQRSFHDRIIRDQTEYWIKYWYIKNNPKNWDNDNSLNPFL